jgi:hypothetical protein
MPGIRELTEGNSGNEGKGSLAKKWWQKNGGNPKSEGRNPKVLADGHRESPKVRSEEWPALSPKEFKAFKNGASREGRKGTQRGYSSLGCGGQGDEAALAGIEEKAVSGA